MRRYQLSRQKPLGRTLRVRSVARPTWFGNPFIGDQAVRAYREFLADVVSGVVLNDYTEVFDCIVTFRKPLDGWEELRGMLLPRRESELFGRNLGCWCPTDRPCHAGVLLDLFAHRGAVDAWVDRQHALPKTVKDVADAV